MTFKVYDPKYPNIEAAELLDKLNFWTVTDETTFKVIGYAPIEYDDDVECPTPLQDMGRILETIIPVSKERLVMAEKNDTQNMIHAVTTVQYTKQDFLDILKVFFDGCAQLIRVAKEPPSSI